MVRTSCCTRKTNQSLSQDNLKTGFLKDEQDRFCFAHKAVALLGLFAGGAILYSLTQRSVSSPLTMADPAFAPPQNDMPPFSSFKRSCAIQPALPIFLNDAVCHPAFFQCRKTADYLKILYPPEGDLMPEKWESWIDKLPPAPLYDRFLGEANRLSKGAQWPSLNTLDAKIYEMYSETVLTPHAILDFLKQNHPLFAKAWELANEEAPLKFALTDKEEPRYDPRTHSFTLSKIGSNPTKSYGFLFFTIQALFRPQFLALEDLLEKRSLGREAFTFLKEWIHYEPFVWSRKMADPCDQRYEKPSFLKYWQNANKPMENLRNSHADLIRQEWDRQNAESYFAAHPNQIERRLKELDKGAS